MNNFLMILITILRMAAFEPDDITEEMLINANDYTIEYCLSIITDEAGNGEVINTESAFNYISFRDLPVEVDDLIETYLVYEPGYSDGIVLRIDVLPDGNVYIN